MAGLENLSRVTRLVLSDDGSTLAAVVANDDRRGSFKTLVWDMRQSAKLISKKDYGAGQNLVTTPLAVSADGRWLAQAGGEWQVEVYAPADPGSAPQHLEGHQ